MAIAVALTAALVAYPLWEPRSIRRVLILVGLAAVLTLLAAVLARWPRVVGWGLALLALEYGFSLIERDGLDVGAPLYAASLLVLGEVVAALAGARLPNGPERFRREAARVLAIAVLAATAASVVLVGAAVAGERSALVQVGGVAAAGIVLVLLVAVTNERTGHGDEERPTSVGS